MSKLRVRLIRGLKKAFSSLDESFAEGIAQEASLKILERIDQFQGRSQFPIWAMAIAVRLGTSQIRRKHFQGASLHEITNGERLQIELAEVVTVSRTVDSLILGSRKEPENGEGEYVE